MAWAWVVLVVVAVGIPVAVGLRSRSLKPPREPYGSPVPKLDRVDRWLYDQYQLGNLDRAQITQAVIEGRELTDPRLRPAAHGLAAAMLTGQVGVLTRRTERKLLGAVLGLMIAIAAVALATGKFTMLVPAVTGVALLPVSARMWTRDRRRVERARQLNAQAARHVPIRPAEDAPD
jgi:Flp pilus assembly protein TadB